MQKLKLSFILFLLISVSGFSQSTYKIVSLTTDTTLYYLVPIPVLLQASDLMLEHQIMTTEIQQCQQAMLLVDSLIAVNDQIKANNALKEKDYKNTLEVKDKVINEAVDRIYYYKDRNAKLERNMKIGFVGLGALVILFAIL